jgi:ABC transporter substrate binding protein
MRELGYVEDKDVDIVYRYADGDVARFLLLAEELVRLKPDVIVASNSVAAIAVKHATTTIPIVSAALTDPVGLGVVASYARPGGQVTGVLSNVDGLPGKLLELLREVVPGAARIGVLVNLSDPSSAFQLQDADPVSLSNKANAFMVRQRLPQRAAKGRGGGSGTDTPDAAFPLVFLACPPFRLANPLRPGKAHSVASRRPRRAH